MRSSLLLAPAIAIALLTAPPARAQATIYQQCTSAVVKLRNAGIIQSITSHGANPRGFDLLVNQSKWRMIDPNTQSRIVRTAACFVVQGDGTIQISGLVHDATTDKELGAMSLSGEYFPTPSGVGTMP